MWISSPGVESFTRRKIFQKLFQAMNVYASLVLAPTGNCLAYFPEFQIIKNSSPVVQAPESRLPCACTTRHFFYLHRVSIPRCLHHRAVSTPWCLHYRGVTVPDRRSRSLEVVIVRRLVTWVLGIWRGEGLGKGLRKGRSVYKQPETEVDGSCHSKEGSK